jgi:hypothetical protein
MSNIDLNMRWPIPTTDLDKHAVKVMSNISLKIRLVLLKLYRNVRYTSISGLTQTGTPCSVAVLGIAYAVAAGGLKSCCPPTHAFPTQP